MGEASGEMILIDTNVFIDHLRNHTPAVNLFESLSEREDVLFSAITETELLAGRENDNPSKRETLLHFLARWGKVTVDNPLAALAGDLAREYHMQVPDALIAASAISYDAELWTRNIKDFKGIRRLRIKSPY